MHALSAAAGEAGTPPVENSVLFAVASTRLQGFPCPQNHTPVQSCSVAIAADRNHVILGPQSRKSARVSNFVFRLLTPLVKNSNSWVFSLLLAPLCQPAANGSRGDLAGYYLKYAKLFISPLEICLPWTGTAGPRVERRPKS